MNHQVTKTAHGYEVWDGIAFENPPLAFASRAEATAAAKALDEPRRYYDESAGSVLTGRDHN